jgi:hypothetical protein
MRLTLLFVTIIVLLVKDCSSQSSGGGSVGGGGGTHVYSSSSSGGGGCDSTYRIVLFSIFGLIGSVFLIGILWLIYKRYQIFREKKYVKNYVSDANNDINADAVNIPIGLSTLKGYYLGNADSKYNQGRHDTTLNLEFVAPNIIHGSGEDVVGSSTIKGYYNTHSGKIGFIKKYINTDNKPVMYTGIINNNLTMNGNWKIIGMNEAGTFQLKQIQEQNEPKQQELQQEKPETIENIV